MIDAQKEARSLLKEIKDFLPRNTVKTLYSQINSGDVLGALKGIQKVMKRYGLI